MSTSATPIAAAIAVIVAAFCLSVSAQQGLPPITPVRPIQPPAHPLPPESATARNARFSFIVYGDTRCTCAAIPNVAGAPPPLSPLPGTPEREPEHAKVIEALVGKVKALARTNAPVRFVLQTGDAVYRGIDVERWDVFRPLAERITRELDLPFFFVPGNHDLTVQPADGDPGIHAMGLHNTLAAVSRLVPPEGSPRRLNGYDTFAFGYGNTFVIGFDSNIANDRLQVAWVANQLEHLDRARYRHVVAFFHHPPYTSGRYSGVVTQGTLPSGNTTSAGAAISPQATALRAIYMPLFRKHHVRLLLTGHDHLFDHWAERYVDKGTAYRMDVVISGGGGAPTYLYTGEPNLDAYMAEGRDQQLRVEHIARPGPAIEDNPHHFIVVRVDGDKLSLEIIGTGPRPYTPWNGKATIDLQ
jgi:hypothetical protein